MGELRCGGVAVWGSRGVGESQCGGGMVWGSRGMGELRYVRVAVVTTP